MMDGESMLQEGCGRIELIIGPMFSGKTSALMNRIKREIHALRTCYVIKYARETRYDVKNVASHDEVKFRAQVAVTRLSDLGDAWKSYDVIAVDEGQFFPDIVSFCNKAADAGKIVLVSALDADYRREPFGQVCNLVAVCESVTKLSAVCVMCRSRPASFSRRTADAEEQELIGGVDMYVATCRRCYNLKIGPSEEAMERVYHAIRKVREECLGPTVDSVQCVTPPLHEYQESLDETGSSVGPAESKFPSPDKNIVIRTTADKVKEAREIVDSD
ncbi:unnamed protein product [Phytomonas sp. EM1]|nr:unnamed protein product [Phytomonas sp. EM1]|eukprot:CCW62957.1 unnamed protein product [Phytomonas sp. isolate EM1]